MTESGEVGEEFRLGLKMTKSVVLKITNGSIYPREAGRCYKSRIALDCQLWNTYRALFELLLLPLAHACASSSGQNYTFKMKICISTG